MYRYGVADRHNVLSLTVTLLELCVPSTPDQLTPTESSPAAEVLPGPLLQSSLLYKFFTHVLKFVDVVRRFRSYWQFIIDYILCEIRSFACRLFYTSTILYHQLASCYIDEDLFRIPTYSSNNGVPFLSLYETQKQGCCTRCAAELTSIGDNLTCSALVLTCHNVVSFSSLCSAVPASF